MKIYTSEKGFLCGEIDGKNIHSRYNPIEEARRFIQRTVTGKPSLIILLGAGLGYIQEILAGDFPGVPVLAVFYSDELYGTRFFNHNQIHCWFPSSSESIETFFSFHIHETSLRTLKIAEWEPSARIFPDLSVKINLALKTTVQELNGNIQTTAFFGKKWIENMVINFLLTDRYCQPVFPDLPVLIVSSGPTLLESIEQIRDHRDRIILYALPSSLKTLSHFAITPDLQISTDPGYYGGLHLYHSSSNVPLAAPFTSCRKPGIPSHPVLVLNQNTPFERDLFSQVPIPCIDVPSNGTVSGTAYALAARNKREIFFAGLDLCFYDILSHTRPHTFDSLLESASYRMKPLHSVYFDRAFDAVPDYEKGIRISRSLDTYRNWFAKSAEKSSFIANRLNPSPVFIENFGEGHLSVLKAGELRSSTSLNITEAMPVSMRLKKVKELIKQWKKDMETGKNEELRYFIDTIGYTKGQDSSAALRFLERLETIYG